MNNENIRDSLMQIKKRYKKIDGIKKDEKNKLIVKESEIIINDHVVRQAERQLDNKRYWLKEGINQHFKSGVEARGYFSKRKLDVPHARVIGYNPMILLMFLLLWSISFIWVTTDMQWITILLSIFMPLYIWVFSASFFTRYDPNDNDLSNNYVNSKNVFISLNNDDITYWSNSHFQNGNVKKGERDKGYEYLFKKYVLSNSTLKDRQELSFKDTLITDINSFSTLGGIYAWVYEGEIVYVGKAKNFKQRIRQHRTGIISGAGVKKYAASLDISRVYIRILSITNDLQEQSVMESYWYWVLGEPEYNSVVPLTMKKIQSNKAYVEILKKLT